MDAVLEIVEPAAQAGCAFPLEKRAMLIGRAPACQIRASAPGVSRVHCAALLRDGRPFVMDLGSSYGTFVNGARTHGETELCHGDALQVGALRFRVYLVEACLLPPKGPDTTTPPRLTESTMPPHVSATAAGHRGALRTRSRRV